MQPSTVPIIVELKAISPLAFSIAREGDKAVIKYKPPKLNEYRDKIGPASESYLVFKGETKIGMIPNEFIKKINGLTFKKVCRIAGINQVSNVIFIEVFFIEKI